MSYHVINAYKKVERTTSSERENEARVLSEGALKLERCLDAWDSAENKAALKEALRYNQMIWTVFQSALISADCPLPEDIRRNILVISRFMDKQIFRSMASPSREKLEPIIVINRGLAKGLRMTPQKGVVGADEVKK
ncbi:MAG: flagellar biosynthesis regulator FlaF [Thermodesulfobacteriota bacterium]